MKKIFYQSCFITLVGVLSLFAQQKYMDLFISNSQFQKKGEYVTVHLHLPKMSSLLRSVAKDIEIKLTAEGWNKLAVENLENYQAIIRIFVGVDLEEYKKGSMKKGQTVVVLVDGKDFITDIKSKSDSQQYASEVLKHVQDGL